jgi:hypothetical protein
MMQADGQRRSNVTKLKGQVRTVLTREAVFDYVADFANQADWDPNTQSATRIDEGPVGVGARYRLMVKVGPRMSPMEYRIVEFERPSRVLLVGEGSGVSARDEIVFSDTTEYGRRLRTSTAGTLGLMQPLLGGPSPGSDATPLRGCVSARWAGVAQPPGGQPGTLRSP